MTLDASASVYVSKKIKILRLQYHLCSMNMFPLLSSYKTNHLNQGDTLVPPPNFTCHVK
jgi:hypothetical protein